MHQQVGISGRAGRERKGSETDDSGERTFQGRDLSRGRYLELPHVESRWNEDHPDRTEK